MVIHFKDGSHAECSKVEIIGSVIYWDDCRYYDANEVEEITDD